MVGGVACPFFILLSYFPAHCFYTIDFWSYFLVPVAQTSAEFAILSAGHLIVLHDFCWLLRSILCNRLNWIHVTLEKVVSYRCSITV